MRKKLIYTPNLNGLKIIKNENEQHRRFFYSGHPYFLIPDFCDEPNDIWLSFIDFLEKEIGDEIWDQNGGEVESKGIISADGLTKCVYTAYGIQKTEDSEEEDFDVEVTGYVVEELEIDEVYFVATKVEIKWNFFGYSFKPVEYFGGVEKLKYTIENDKIKNKFCKENKIKMIRIPYTQLCNIEKILSEKLKI